MSDIWEQLDDLEETARAMGFDLENPNSIQNHATRAALQGYDPEAFEKFRRDTAILAKVMWKAMQPTLEAITQLAQVIAETDAFKKWADENEHYRESDSEN